MSSTTVRDRRYESSHDKFGTDRERFHRKYRQVIRKAVYNDAEDRGFRDLDQDGLYVPIPKEGIREPVIQHKDDTGHIRRVFAGNAYDEGDIIPKPPCGQGKGGKKASDDDETSEDDFVWISPDEYLNILFEGRELPDMTKLSNKSVVTVDRKHAGYTDTGPSHRLARDITNKKRKSDEIALTKVAERRVIQNLREQFNILAGYGNNIPQLDFSGQNAKQKLDQVSSVLRTLQEQHNFNIETDDSKRANLRPLLSESVGILKHTLGLREVVHDENDLKRLGLLEQRLPEHYKAQKRAGKFRQEHLTYDKDDESYNPKTQAVMLLKMDVSASMTQEDKNAAKSFFWLLHRFLKTKYDNVDVVFIAHTTKAKEVDENTFFHGRETGGTKVSSALQEAKEIIEKRYPPSEWNIYCAQASDGDNIPNDNPVVTNLLEKELLPISQAYYYTEIGEARPHGDTLLPIFEGLAQHHSNVFYDRITAAPEAVDTFKKFFPKDGRAPAQGPQAKA